MKKVSGTLKNNYIVVQSWMTQELGLKGNSLILYALIYGFSQTEKQSCTCGIEYMQAWTHSSKQGVLNALDALVNAGLIERVKSNSADGRISEYRIIGQQSLPNSDKKKVKKVDPIPQKLGQESLPISEKKGQESLPNFKKIGQQSCEIGQQSLPNSLPPHPPNYNIYNINNTVVSQTTRACARAREDDGRTDDVVSRCLERLKNIKPSVEECMQMNWDGSYANMIELNCERFESLINSIVKRKSIRINNEAHSPHEVIETLSELLRDRDTLYNAFQKLPMSAITGIRNRKAYEISTLYNFVNEEL